MVTQTAFITYRALRFDVTWSIMIDIVLTTLTSTCFDDVRLHSGSLDLVLWSFMRRGNIFSSSLFSAFFIVFLRAAPPYDTGTG